jgi:hypothetical protein
VQELARWRYIQPLTNALYSALAGEWSGIPEFRIVGLAEVPSFGDPREEPRRVAASGLFLLRALGAILHMSDQRLGRLERVELRDIWTSEATSFTRCLARPDWPRHHE